jgi:hypothetical protein
MILMGTTAAAAPMALSPWLLLIFARMAAGPHGQPVGCSKKVRRQFVLWNSRTTLEFSMLVRPDVLVLLL